MKVSLNLLKKFTNIELSNEQLLEVIGAQLGAVEEVTDLSLIYKDVKVVKVVGTIPHPNADRLKICLIDDGHRQESVERNNDGLIQVVCGAPNVVQGQVVAWLPPGSIVPVTASKHPVTLDSREIRGEKSNGMIASPRELNINDEHEGILVLDESLPVGSSFADIFELNDLIIDIENKMFTHRPDCFGHLGIAREIAGITKKEFHSPDWYINPKLPESASGRNINIKNEIKDLVPRFMVQVVENVEVKSSSLLIQSYLNRLGIRPINNIVDQTNYIMILTAQPLHAYDYDKLVKLDKSDTATIVVRKPKENETLPLLNGKTVKLEPNDILISTESVPIGLGGVMGGSESEVDENTKNIVIECANFDMYTIRSTAMRHGLFTDAVTRFTKNQSALQNPSILAFAASSIIECAGGNTGQLVDEKTDIAEPEVVDVSTGFINTRLGSDLSSSEINRLLTNVEFGISSVEEDIKVKPPFWRTDIHIPEDVVEEVGRLHGYNNLPISLPNRTILPAPTNKSLALSDEIRALLSSAGANEMLTYSFVHGSLIENTGLDREASYQLSNAISPDLQYYRQSLLPSILEKIYPNLRSGHQEFVVFEINKVHIKGLNDETDTNLPKELSRLGVVYASDSKHFTKYNSGSSYYIASKYLRYLLDSLGLEYTFEPLTDFSPAAKPFELKHSAVVKSSDRVLAVVGEPKQGITSKFKLPITAMFELDLDVLASLNRKLSYKPNSTYPAVSYDVCYKTDQRVTYFDLFNMQKKFFEVFSDLRVDISPVDIYSQEDNVKQQTYHLEISSYKKTLTSGEVNDLISKLGEEANKQFSAQII